MSTLLVLPLIMRSINWIARTVTAYHLWCAEQELRLQGPRDMLPALRTARARNLALLREYRRRGEFPRNRHDPNRCAPSFIDTEGRQCAVAYLMHASGNETSATMIAQSANYARIRDMHFSELKAWASESGLTKAELARIQPGYAPTPDQLQNAFDFLYAIWLIGSVALMTIVVNSSRLVVAFAQRFNTRLLGILSGVVLVSLCVRINAMQFAYTSLIDEVGIYRAMGIGIGIVAVAFAVIPLFWQRAEPASTSPIKQPLVELLSMVILAIAFLIIPVLVYLKVVGPTSESRFQSVHQHGHQDVIMGVALSGDGMLVVTASGDGTAVLWDATNGKRVRTFYRGHTDGITSVAMSSDAKYIVTGSMDQKAVLWDTSSGEKLRTFPGHTWWIDSVALSRDGRYLATGSSDKTAILWEAATGRRLQTFSGHSLVVTSVAFNADGTRVVTGSYDKTAILWDAGTSKKIQTFGKHDDFVSSVAVSSDGRHVVTGSWDQTAILWDADSGKKLQTFQGHTHRVMSVAVSADAGHVVTGSTDNTAALWDGYTGKWLQTFRGHLHPVMSVAVSGDGKQVVTGSGDNKAILWEASTGKRLQTFGNWH